MKKIISMVLVVSLLLCIKVESFADTNSTNSVTANGITSYILEDSDTLRVVETPYDNGKIIAEYNKTENTLTMKTYNKTNILTTKIIKLNSFKSQENNYDLASMMNRSSKREYQKTWSNFEFTRFSDNKWEIVRPDPKNPTFDRLYFTIQQNDDNYDTLRKYRTVVNNINSKEGEVIVYTGISTLCSGLTGALTAATGIGGAAAGAAFTSLGLTGIGLTKAIELGNLCEEALGLYWDLYDMK